MYRQRSASSSALSSLRMIRHWFAPALLLALLAPRAVGASADLAKSALAVTPAISYSAKAGNVFVLSRGSDGHIYWMRGLDVPFGPFDLTARLGAPLATGKPKMYPGEDPDGGAAIYRAVDGHVQLMVQEFSRGWTVTDITGSSGAPHAAGDPTVGVFRTEAGFAVMYRDKRGRIYELWKPYRSPAWVYADVTAATRAPRMVGDLVFGSRVGAATVYYYRGVGGRIYELATAGDVWSVSHVGAGADTPAAASDPVSISRPGFVTLAYRGAGGNIYVLSRSELSSAWTLERPSLLASAPRAAGTPTRSLVGAPGVTYRGADKHLYDLSFSGGVWRVTDLNGHSDAPLALNDPAVVVYSDFARPIVYRVVGYRGVDGRLHELRNTGVPGEWTPRVATLTPWNP